MLGKVKLSIAHIRVSNPWNHRIAHWMHPDPESPQSIVGRASLVFPPLQGPRLCLMMIELARWQIEAWQNQWSIFTPRVPHSGTLSSRWSSGGGKSEVITRGWEGFATKTIPQGAPLPTEHSKITIVHRIGCSLNLSISYYCFLCFWGIWVWLVEYGQAINRQTLPHVRPPAVTKSPNFWAGIPPARLRGSITDFSIYGAISHKKSCGSFGGQGGSEAKSPAFCNGRHYGKQSPDSRSKASVHACGVGSYVYFIRPSIISFAQNLKPLDPSKAHAYHTQKSLKT